MTETIDSHAYFDALRDALEWCQITNTAGDVLTKAMAFSWLRENIHDCHDRGGKLVFIGNGGSSGIASHLAIDYTKNGGVRSVAFNDVALLTCFANDFGYEKVFASAVRAYMGETDILIAISSSGRSPNILNAVEAADERNCRIVTLSGFDKDNPLREMGHLNFYVSSHTYGLVEVSHLALMHGVLDLDMGWKPHG